MMMRIGSGDMSGTLNNQAYMVASRTDEIGGWCVKSVLW